MNQRKEWFRIVFLIVLVLLGTLLITGCSSKLRVGELKTESQLVELGDTNSVKVEINFGAGDLRVNGGAEKLLEANFTYNVSRLKPEVEFADDTLIVRQPDVKGLPALGDLVDFRNEWDMRLNNQIPMDLSVNIGAGTSELQLAGLSLTGLDIQLGASETTIDLSGSWLHDLDVTIEAGVGHVILRLPKTIGVRVEVETAIGSIDALDLKQDGNVYTNAAYGISDVALQINMEAGIGQITLEESNETQEVFAGAQITGWVWHDLCESGKDGQPAPSTTPPGCVKGVSPLGPYHADGLLAIDEPLIEGVVVTLGEGSCPSTGLAETSTIVTDLSYSFSSLKPGTYCVSIDPQREPNFSILKPGIWTFPTISQDVIQTTVTVEEGEYKGMVNFGWDYQFQP